MISQTRPERFLISWDLLKACGTREVFETYADMLELGIAKMPYPLTEVSLPTGLYSDEIQKPKDPDDITLIFGPPGNNSVNCQATYSFENETCVQAYYETPSSWKNNLRITYPETLPEFERDRSVKTVRMLLIVLLATKNIVKTRTKNKLAALGIGKNKATRAIYTTTLSLPVQFQSSADRHGVTGLSLRPHLRRGHIRNQRHGPKLEFVKKIWVEPCFVNSDEEYVSQRFSYNVSQREARP